MKFIKKIRSAIASRFNTEKERPLIVNFPITDNCNSKCIMCNIWKNKSTDEITPNEIRELLEQDYFKDVKHLGISGGEPTLRDDLVQCIQSIVESLNHLESISITSHGYHNRKWETIASEIKILCEKNNVGFSVNISIDGDESTHNKIRGKPQAYKRAQETIDILKSKNIPVQIQCTISRDNVFSIYDVLAFSKSKDCSVVFRCATSIFRLYNDNLIDKFSLSDNQNSFIADFFLSEELHQNTESIGRGLYYEAMAKNLTGRQGRNMPCYFQKQGCLISSQGELSICSVTSKSLGNYKNKRINGNFYELNNHERDVIVKDTCKVCTHDQSGSWSIYSIISYIIRRKYKKIYSHYCKSYKAFSLAAKIITSYSYLKKKELDVVGDDINSILVIGAYGGEHVGDAAILGGVVLRCLHKYPSIKSVTVSSFRPDRTKRWADSLRLPVEINVIRDTAIKDNITFDMVVYGGGPLMDLPVHLANHLNIVTYLNSIKIPFIVEGVGYGPVKSFMSKVLIKKLLKYSSFIRVRTIKAKCDIERLGFKDVLIDQDPAFDYLGYVRNHPSKEVSDEKFITNIEDDKNIKIGINLRPLWSKYSFSKSNVSDVELNYLSELSKSLIKVSEIKRVSFYYFPMNADCFGMSDFIVAKQLSEFLMKYKIPLHIWYDEPDVEKVMKFISKMDCIVSMRFHGCIFALSNNTENVISIDYQIGKNGKVTDVMYDKRGNGNMHRVDTLNHIELTNNIINILENVHPSNDINCININV